MRYLLAVVVVLLVGYLLTAVTVVHPGERAVVRRFGRMLDDQLGPGLHIGYPWGIDRVDRVAIDEWRRVMVGYQPQDFDRNAPALPLGQLVTADHNLVNVLVIIGYHVREEEVADFVVQQNRVDTLVSSVTEALLAEWTAGHGVDDILRVGKAELPGWLVEHAQAGIEPYHLGIEIRAVSVADLSYPDEVRADFERVTQAEANKKQKINKAQAEASEIIANAKAMQTTIEKEAAAEKEKKIKLAEAEAGRFAERLRQNEPELTVNRGRALNRIWRDEMALLYRDLKEKGQIQLLDHYLTGDGLDLTTFAPLPKK